MAKNSIHVYKSLCKNPNRSWAQACYIKFKIHNKNLIFKTKNLIISLHLFLQFSSSKWDKYCKIMHAIV